MKDGVSVVDQDCGIQYGNPALEVDFGPWKGRKCYEYFEEREDACPWCDSDAVIGGKTTRAESYSRKANKTYDLIATPLRLPDGMFARLEIRRDITERILAERELRALNETLEQRVADRTAALEQRAIQLRRLTAELTQAEQRERRRLAQILHDHLQQLLFGAKLQVGALRSENVDLSVLTPALAQLEDLLHQSINASRSLTVELYPPILRAEGLEQVLEWLVSWVRDHHGLDVELSTEIDAVPIAEDVRVTIFHAVRELLFNVIKHAGVGRARVRASDAGDDRLKIVVSDEGAGFEPSRVHGTADPSAGFGLFGVRERRESLGGELDLDSSPGRGTRVTLLLPVSMIEQSEQHSEAGVPDRPQESMSTAAVEPIRAPSKAGQTIRVLVADDHESAREGLATLLQKEPDIVVIGEAADGEAAVEMALHMRPDVVIMDVDMPRLNGIEATRRIVKDLSGVSVVALSMHNEPEMATAMYEAGAGVYLDKAGPFEALLNVIRELAPV
jgi:signal transduction histidine kinase